MIPVDTLPHYSERALLDGIAVAAMYLRGDLGPLPVPRAELLASARQYLDCLAARERAVENS